MTIATLPTRRADLPRSDWRDDAQCAQTDPEAFFPRPGTPTDRIRGICDSCPVQWECLADALNIPNGPGYLAGLSPKQRAKLRRLGYDRAAVIRGGREGVPMLLIEARARV